MRTDMIMYSLRRMHVGPISFHSAFYFNLGQQFLVSLSPQSMYWLEQNIEINYLHIL
jgi:hypothetical protein